MWFRRILSAKPRFAVRPVNSSSSKPAQLVLSAHALRQLNRLQLNTHPFLPGYAHGSRPSQRRKPAFDFREHRIYTPGDDVRFVDWKASARQEHIFIKQGEHLKDAAVYVLLDCSASMTWGQPPKTHALLPLAAALSYLALGHGDRLMIVPLTDRARGASAIQPLGMVSGKGQFPGLLNYLRALPYGGQIDLAQSLAGFSRRHPMRGGLVLILSDLLDVGDLATGLKALPMPAWNVVMLHLLHPLEITPSLRGDYHMQDIETGQKKHYTVTDRALETYQQRLQAWRKSLESACLERKVFYTLVPTGWSLENEIIPHLREVNLVKAL